MPRVPVNTPAADARSTLTRAVSRPDSADASS